MNENYGLNVKWGSLDLKCDFYLRQLGEEPIIDNLRVEIGGLNVTDFFVSEFEGETKPYPEFEQHLLTELFNKLS